MTVWGVASGAALHALEAPGGCHGELCRCHVALAVGAAFDPGGFGRGLSWRELPPAARAAR